jgi:predicted dehydrogenase/threonine dehydrogenase-like Zn-dependent dehydrogenase
MSKQVLVSRGTAFVADVPASQIEPGEVLVAVQFSCLSIGTEMSGVRSTSVPMWKRALNQPEKLVTTINAAASHGIQYAWKMVNDKKNEAHPTGYSAAGIVIEVGKDIKDISVGDRVACAGAPHAEIIKVPRNLCVSMPDNLDWESASTVTLGAIAMQGVRRAQPTLGECFVVIGLGILGQLTTQLLKVNGCRTIGIDLDLNRVQTATELGMDYGMQPEAVADIEQVMRLTDGIGADGVIITAATPSDAIISTAFKMCRKKGRVVLVGDVGLNLNRRDFYAKEIDFYISTSYGPGRYDRNYEEKGLDYPVPYVRWTENRNMLEYIKLLAEKKVRVAELISSIYDIDKTQEAYSTITEAANKPLMVLLRYPDNTVKGSAVLKLKNSSTPVTGQINVALVGAGGFARAVHLPNILHLKNDFSLHTVVNRTGHVASAVGKQFNAEFAATEYDQVVNDPNVHAVIICTRHDQHASMVLKALKAGKHVLVEKPLIISADELEEMNDYINNAKESELPVLLTGYNRRFSPYALDVLSALEKRSGPFMMNYRMNAGFIPSDHWVHGNEGGGRNIGEACHIYDLFTALAGCKVTTIQATSIKPASAHYLKNDNFNVNLKFEDGSVCSLTYTSLGDKNFSKETCEVYFDGKIAVLDDYKKLEYHGSARKSIKNKIQDKGHMTELKAFAESIHSGNWSIPWWQQYQAAMISLEVEKQILK